MSLSKKQILVAATMFSIYTSGVALAATAPTKASASLTTSVVAAATTSAASPAVAAPATSPQTTATQVVPASKQKQAVQLELEISKNAHYKVFSLPNPPRIIVDVKGNAASTEFDKSSLANTPVKGVRSARHDDGVLRIAFDLKEAMTFKVQEVVGSNANSTKLVISLLAAAKK